MRGTRTPFVVGLLLGLLLAATTHAALVAPPDATVERRSLPEWGAQWWKSVFAIPVYAADGTTVIHPQSEAGLAEGDTLDTLEYTQPAERSITQTFFGIDAPGLNESAADGYYLMLLPLAPGEHTLSFTGSSPDNTATPPLLAAFDVSMTYHLNVEDAAVIALPAGVWLGLAALPLLALAIKGRRRTRFARCSAFFG
jgi:hypothetical protein